MSESEINHLQSEIDNEEANLKTEIRSLYPNQKKITQIRAKIDYLKQQLAKLEREQKHKSKGGFIR